MVTFTLSQSIYEFAKLRVIRAMCASMVYVATCQSAKPMPTSHFLRANKRANVLKVCQLFNLVCQHAKGEPIFQLRLPKGVPVFQLFFKIIFRFLNFLIILNICKLQEYLGNSRKLISRNKEYKF